MIPARVALCCGLVVAQSAFPFIPTIVFSSVAPPRRIAPPPVYREVVAAIETEVVPEPTPEPTPEPKPAPTPVVVYAAPASVEAEIWRIFGTRVAVAVFKQESGLRADAFNGSCCYGVAQIHLAAHWGDIPGATAAEKIAWLYNPTNNLLFAKRMYDAQGWGPWEAYTSGIYLKYL